MALSIFDLFKVGIGPSSSHTVGPMWAAHRFLLELDSRKLFGDVERVKADRFGSLALTGKGHATDVAVIVGLSGERPDRVNPDIIEDLVARVHQSGRLNLAGKTEVPFVENEHLVFHFLETLPEHPNGMRLAAFGANGTVLTAGYMLRMLQRVNLGEPSEEWVSKDLHDADRFELAAWVPLVVATLAIGIFPKIVFGATDGAVVALVDGIKSVAGG